MGKINKISVIFILSLFILVLLVQGIISMNGTRYSPVYVSNVTIYDDIDTFGVFLREEIPLNTEMTDLTYIALDSGDKVARGDDIAFIYEAEEYLSLNQKLLDLQSEKEILDSITVVNLSSSQNTRTAILLNNEIALLNQNLDNADISSTYEIIEEIKSMSQKSAYAQMSKEELDARKAIVNAEILSTEQTLQSKVSAITSPDAGYYIKGTDGYEELIVEDLTCDYINGLKNQSIEFNSESSGKIITDFKWKLAVTVPNDNLEALLSADRPRIFIENISDMEIPIEIIDVIEEENESIVIFEGDFQNELLLETRATDVKIILKEVEGIKIPKEATRVIENEIGVYAIRGYQVNYKEIEPIFEGEDFYIIDKNNGSIISGDSIAKSSKDLSDNKVIK